MSQLPHCPKCQSPYTYEDGFQYVCPDGAHEWNEEVEKEEVKQFRDAHGNLLEDGDTITVIKDLKIKGSSQVDKRRTALNNIRLIDRHPEIHCKTTRSGPMQLKTPFVKKI